MNWRKNKDTGLWVDLDRVVAFVEPDPRVVSIQALKDSWAYTDGGHTFLVSPEMVGYLVARAEAAK